MTFHGLYENSSFAPLLWKTKSTKTALYRVNSAEKWNGQTKQCPPISLHLFLRMTWSVSQSKVSVTGQKKKKKRKRKTSIASHSVFCFYFASYFIFNQDLLIVTRLVLTIWPISQTCYSSCLVSRKCRAWRHIIDRARPANVTSTFTTDFSSHIMQLYLVRRLTFLGGGNN